MGMVADTSIAQKPMVPLLQKAEMAIEHTLKPDMQKAYHRIVTAGITIAFSKATHGTLMQGLDQSKDPIHDVAIGTVGLLLSMYKQSKNTMPTDAMVPAGFTLMLHGLDYLQRTKGIQIGNDQIVQAHDLYMSTLLPKIGLTPQVMAKATNQAHGAMQNPQLMQKFKQSTEGGV